MVMDLSRSRTQIISEVTTAERVVQADQACAKPVYRSPSLPGGIADETVLCADSCVRPSFHHPSWAVWPWLADHSKRSAETVPSQIAIVAVTMR